MFEQLVLELFHPLLLVLFGGGRMSMPCHVLDDSQVDTSFEPVCDDRLPDGLRIEASPLELVFEGRDQVTDLFPRFRIPQLVQDQLMVVVFGSCFMQVTVKEHGLHFAHFQGSAVHPCRGFDVDFGLVQVDVRGFQMADFSRGEALENEQREDDLVLVFEGFVAFFSL